MSRNDQLLDKSHGGAEGGGGRKTIKQIIQEDWRLLTVVAVIVVLENVKYGRYVLYPFTIFSTWVHELCHGLAAIMVGGNIVSLRVYADGSGLAYNSIPSGRFQRVTVASAGYVGTAFLGCLLLLFRRTKRGPRIGTTGLGIVMVLSTCMYVRNPFGLGMLIPMGVIITLCGFMLPSKRMRDVYTVLAATCSLNAITSIHDLFGSSFYVNGDATETDAHTVADNIYLPYQVVAFFWLLLALATTTLGIVFPVKDPNWNPEDDLPCCMESPAGYMV